MNLRLKLCASLVLIVPLLIIFNNVAANHVAADSLTTAARIILPPLQSSLDPVSLPKFDRSARDIDENLFVGLARYDVASGKVQPMLAKDWSVSADGLTWTFNLRDDV